MKAKKNPATEQRQDEWLSSENKTCTLLNEHIRFKHHLDTEQSLPKMTPRLQVWLRNKRNNAGGLMLSDLVQPVLTFLQVPNPCCGLAMLQMRRHWRSPWTSPSDSSMGGTNEAAQPCRLAGPKPVCVLLSRTAPKSPACWLVTAMSNHLGVFTWGCSEFRVSGARATTLSAHLSPGSYKWIIHKPILPSEKKKKNIHHQFSPPETSCQERNCQQLLSVGQSLRLQRLVLLGYAAHCHSLLFSWLTRLKWPIGANK